MAKRSKSELSVTSIAALLVAVAAFFAAFSWITSGKAGSSASKNTTAALGIEILRLESVTNASNARIEQQTYLTQAALYWQYAEKAADNENKAILENIGDIFYLRSELARQAAENEENRAQTFLNAYEDAMDSATVFGKVADSRSTAALLFNVSAIVATCGVILKRMEILYVYIPFFMLGMYYLVPSLF